MLPAPNRHCSPRRKLRHQPVHHRPQRRLAPRAALRHLERMTRMAPIPAALAALLLAAPAHAHDPDAPPPGAEEEPQLSIEALEEKARRALGFLSDRTAEILRQLGEEAEALSEYERPRMLPNGDILIPRKRAAPEGKPALPPGAPPDPDAPVDL